MPGAAEPDYSHCVDLVCEGGGVKGIGLSGAYAVLEDKGYVPQQVAGTSAGAITAAAIAAGYTSAELQKILSDIDYKSFEDESWQDRIPVVGKGLGVLLERGVYEGNAFLKFMRDLLADKGIHTFGDLKKKRKVEGDSPLQVIASDLSARRLLVLPRDAEVLGLEPDELEVAFAVRMSMSIPIFFEPVEIENPETNRRHVIVDGGILSNFPVWLFDAQGRAPRWPTFGLLLVEPEPEQSVAARLPAPEDEPPAFKALGELLTGLFHTMMEAHDRQYLEKAQYARTIPIPTLGVRTTEFDITPERTKALYESGRDAAENFLKTWNFEAYIAEFRSGKEHSRRDELVAQMKGAKPPG